MDTAISLIKKGKQYNIINKTEYEFLCSCVKYGYCINYIDAFIEIINKFDNWTDYIEVPHIINVIDNNSFSVKKLYNIIIEYYKTISFTEDQLKAIYNIIDLCYNKNTNMIGIYGYAGTGKTTVVTRVISYIRHFGYIGNICFTAPTHKALNILKFKYLHDYVHGEKVFKEKYGVDFLTIHKLLGYTIDYDKTGKKIFGKKKRVLMYNYNIIVIDECSMISSDIITELFNEIYKNPTKIIKIIFLGDPAQLPPVNEQLSKLFNNSLPNFNSIILQKIVRNKDTDVNNLCGDVRKWITSNNIPHFMRYNGNVKLYKYDKQSNKTNTKWYSDYVECLKRNTQNNESTVILTWTNEQCRIYNKLTRNMVLRNSSAKMYDTGDILIFNSYYKLPNNGFFHTSEQIKVISAEQIIKNIPIFNNTLPKYCHVVPNFDVLQEKYSGAIGYINNTISKSYVAWRLTVKSLSETKNDINRESDIIYVIDEQSKNKFNKDIMIINEKIMELQKVYSIIYNNNEIIDNNVMKYVWKEVNEKFVDIFADVREGLCITTHKSQGSTFCDVFIDCHDIFKNKEEHTCKRCLYTALTRASNGVYLLI